jgi:molybdenum cofactor cytidylyltransferase
LALEVAVPDRYTLLDIDSFKDYTTLLESFSGYHVPTEEECDVILNGVARVSPEILSHCLKVAEVTENIAQAIAASMVNIDLEAVRAGALLHDVLKGQPDHAAAGGRWLSEMGFGGIAEIVSAHADLPAGMRETSLEAKVVYLADKYVSGDSIIPLEERFQSSMQRYGSDAAVKTEILKRQEQALEVKGEIEKLLRRLLDGIIFT